MKSLICKHTMLKLYSNLKLDLKSQILVCIYFSEYRTARSDPGGVTAPPAGGGRDLPSSDWGAILSFLLPWQVLLYAPLLPLRSHLLPPHGFTPPPGCCVISSSLQPARSSCNRGGRVSSCVAPVPQAGAAMLLCGGWRKFDIRK